MKYPDFLKDGGKIGFIAPSFGCATEPYSSCFNSALTTFEELGYTNVLGPNCYKGDGVGISTAPIAAALELNDFYSSDENDVLITCGGGELMCETISEVDFDKIKHSKPKWILGYSDITNISFLLTTMCDVASIYGYCAGTFGMDIWHKSVSDTLEVLKGTKLCVSNYDKYQIESLKDENNPLASFNCTEKTDIKAYLPEKGINVLMENSIICDNAEFGNAYKVKKGKITFEGRLIGGCLDVLANLIGTRFDFVKEFNEKYKKDGIIWYLEACELNVFSIRRTLWAMKEAGWFQYVKGFIFGRPMNGDDIMNLDRVKAVVPVLTEEFQVPIIIDADIGHVAPMMPIINGSVATVSYVRIADSEPVELNVKMELL